MKKIFLLLALFISIAGIFISCQKEICWESNKPPVAIAGPDQAITLPIDSISLDGSASNDPDGKISEWQWRKISGPASFNIITPSDSITKVKTLLTGIYLFELQVKDNSGLYDQDTIQIIVNGALPPNRPPVANAGADKTITLPISAVDLDGSASTDPDNNIISYEWKKISGPSAYTLSNANAAQTQVTGLVQGVYEFELNVTDAGGFNDKDTVQVTVNSNDPPVNVYVAGMNDGLPVYWKNGTMVTVDNSAGGFSCSSIAVAGSDIYVAGWSNGLFYYEWAAKYWKNGQGTQLGTYAGATSIAVVGTDVYVAGWEMENGGGYAAKYWKNGQAVALTNGGTDASGNSIVVVGNDVYVAGYESGVAKYWKNGQAVSLTNGTNQAYANSIAVVGNDIYVSGSEASLAMYWKNGQGVLLSQGTTTSIAVAGTNVYVAGWEGDVYGLVGGTVSVAKYWKNGQEVLLTNGANYAYATSIAVFGSDVYVAGYEIVSGHYQPKYWKNGQAISLPSNGGWATSIVVVN